MMKHVCAATAVLLMLGNFALAQGSGGGSAGSSGGSATGSGTAGTGTSSGVTGPGSAGSSSQGTTGLGTGNNNALVPPGTTLPGGSQSPSTSSTVGQGSGSTLGQGSGANPYNPQDLLGRSNPQDLTNPRARNPSDTGTGAISGAPQIMVPER